ncbi:MAG TPA: CBS domain-containing protein [Chloroflexota bacterium]|jgi:Mg/Co/Ni transporter MgtE
MLGFEDVLRYAPGKMDWMAFGLPVEGEVAHGPIAADVAVADVPTCRPGERAGQLRRVDLLVVVNERRIVLGAIDGQDLAKAEPDVTAEELMHRAPRTIRPDVPLEQIARHYLGERRYLLVTNSDGILLGVAWRTDIEARLSATAMAGAHQHEHQHG